MKKALKWIWGLIVTALVGYLAVDKYQSRQAEAENINFFVRSDHGRTVHHAGGVLTGRWGYRNTNR